VGFFFFFFLAGIAVLATRSATLDPAAATDVKRVQDTHLAALVRCLPPQFRGGGGGGGEEGGAPARSHARASCYLRIRKEDSVVRTTCRAPRAPAGSCLTPIGSVGRSLKNLPSLPRATNRRRERAFTGRNDGTSNRQASVNVAITRGTLLDPAGCGCSRPEQVLAQLQVTGDACRRKSPFPSRFGVGPAGVDRGARRGRQVGTSERAVQPAFLPRPGATTSQCRGPRPTAPGRATGALPCKPWCPGSDGLLEELNHQSPHNQNVGVATVQ
jgi:hypothetical protein